MTNFFKDLGYRTINGVFKHWEVAQMFMDKYDCKCDNGVLKIFYNGEWLDAYEVIDYLVITIDIRTTKAERDEVANTIKALVTPLYNVNKVH